MKQEYVWLHGWKLLFGLSMLAVSIGWMAQSIQKAYARPPMLKLGDAPYQSFTGGLGNGSQDILLTVPAGQTFIVTGGTSSSPYCHIYENTTLRLNGTSDALTQRGLFSHGQGHLQIAAGSVLSIQASGSSCTYYIEGYLADL